MVVKYVQDQEYDVKRPNKIKLFNM